MDSLWTATGPTDMHHRHSRYIALRCISAIEHSHLRVSFVCVNPYFCDAIWNSSADKDVASAKCSTWSRSFRSNEGVHILCIIDLTRYQARKRECDQMSTANHGGCVDTGTTRGKLSRRLAASLMLKAVFHESV